MNLTLLNDFEYKDRLTICQICEYKTDNWRCSACDCNLLTKARIANENCPVAKWKQKEQTVTILDKQHLSKNTSIQDILKLIEHTPPGGWSPNFHKFDNVQEAFRIIAAQDANRIKDATYPAERFSGRGIVICGGGPKYFPSIYVNIAILRNDLHCRLPIEVYYLGYNEMSFEMVKLLESFTNVRCIDIRVLEQSYPARILAGWESKVYAVMNSSFEEVLFLDADNTLLKEPSFLFEDDNYVKHGAILWPDYPNWVHDAVLWRILGMEYRDEPQIESGQLLINKRESWHQLLMAQHYNNYSDYYFKLFYGDKESFHFGWRYLKKDYALPPPPDWLCNAVIIQKYYDGSWLFSHRAQAKLRLDKTHKRCLEVPLEELTFDYLDELAKKWDGVVRWDNSRMNSEEALLSEKLVGTYEYERIGLDSRKIELALANEIGKGAARLEKNWYIFITSDNQYMSITGDEGLTCLLQRVGTEDTWRGRWVNHEKCEVELRKCQQS